MAFAKTTKPKILQNHTVHLWAAKSCGMQGWVLPPGVGPLWLRQDVGHRACDGDTWLCWGGPRAWFQESLEPRGDFQGRVECQPWGWGGSIPPGVCVALGLSQPGYPWRMGLSLSNTTLFSVPCPDGFSLSTQNKERLHEDFQNLIVTLAGKPRPRIPLYRWTN